MFGAFIDMTIGLLGMLIGIVAGVLAALINSVTVTFFIMIPLLTALVGFILMLAGFRRRGNPAGSKVM